MPSLSEILDYLHEFAPLELAEDWDNVGLLLGDERQDVERVMTCLTLTPDVAAEAMQKNVDLIITHHPILFRAVKQLTTATPEGAMILELIRSQTAVYAPHTAFDSALKGINQQWCDELNLKDIQPLRPLRDSSEDFEGLGSGRFGTLDEETSLGEFIKRLKTQRNLEAVQVVGSPERTVQRVGVACGSAAEFLADATRHGCDVFITGEARFHSCLEARQKGIAMILVGHYASERFACEHLATLIKLQFPILESEPSEAECDPLQWM